MKSIFQSLCAIAVFAVLNSSCSNGAFDSNAASSMSNTPNPLNPPTDLCKNNPSFNWWGTIPMSAAVEKDTLVFSTFQASRNQGFVVVTASAGDYTIAMSISEASKINESYYFGIPSNQVAAVSVMSSGSVYATNNGGCGRFRLLQLTNNHIRGYFYFSGGNGAGNYKNVAIGFIDGDIL
jgi:hypothetical protein